MGHGVEGQADYQKGARKNKINMGLGRRPNMWNAAHFSQARLGTRGLRQLSPTLLARFFLHLVVTWYRCCKRCPVACQATPPRQRAYTDTQCTMRIFGNKVTPSFMTWLGSKDEEDRAVDKLHTAVFQLTPPSFRWPSNQHYRCSHPRPK